MKAAAAGSPGGGFPRTTAQATAAADLGKRLGHTLDAVVYLDVPEPVLTWRLLARGAQDGRTDDTADVTRHRLAVFAEMTRPHIRYYENRGILVTVNADQLAGVRLSRRGRSGRR